MTPATAQGLSFGGTIPDIYDSVLVPVYFEPYAIDIAERVAALNPAKILETACGTGIVTAHLRKRVQGQITATDINPAMLDVARKKPGLKDVLWKEADALSLPEPDKTFDVVVTQFGVMFFPDRLKGMMEAYRVLKPGGTFLFNVWGDLPYNPMSATGREVVREFFKENPPATYNVPYSMHKTEDVLPIIQQAGFSEIRYETLTKPCIAASARIIASGLVEGNPIIHAIRERDPDKVEVLKDKVFHVLVDRFGDHPCQTTMQAIIYTAKKKK